MMEEQHVALHWTIHKDGKSYAIPYTVEVEGGAAVEKYMAECDARDQEADRLFGAAPQDVKE